MTRSLRLAVAAILLALSIPLRLSGQAPAPPTPPGGDQTRPQDPSALVEAQATTAGRVYITGQVHKPGAYALKEKMTVSDLIALAGGLGDYAKGDKIAIVRCESGNCPSREHTVFRFNYWEVDNQRRLEQNIELKPGDPVAVP